MPLLPNMLGWNYSIVWVNRILVKFTKYSDSHTIFEILLFVSKVSKPINNEMLVNAKIHYSEYL